MADTITANLGLTKPEVGASADSWGLKLNENFNLLDMKVVRQTMANSTASQWNIITGDNNPASMAGPFQVRRFANTGLPIDEPFSINRQTGEASFTEKLNLAKGLVAASGNISATAAGSKITGTVLESNNAAHIAIGLAAIPPAALDQTGFTYIVEHVSHVSNGSTIFVTHNTYWDGSFRAYRAGFAGWLNLNSDNGVWNWSIIPAVVAAGAAVSPEGIVSIGPTGVTCHKALGVSGVFNFGAASGTSGGVSGTWAVGGNLTAGSLNVSGTTALGTLNAGATTVGSLNVNSVSSSGVISGTNITASGTLNGNSGGVANNWSAGSFSTAGTLSVGGTSTLGTVNGGNATFAGVNVSSLSSSGGISGTNIGASGQLSGASLSIPGILNADGTSVTASKPLWTPVGSGFVGQGGVGNMLEVRASAGNHSFLTFHIPGSYAANLGIDSSGALLFGGISVGAQYQVWTTREHGAPVTDIRLTHAGDINSGTASWSDPFPGAAATGISISAGVFSIFGRYRYVQKFVNGGWVTVGF